MNTILIPNTTDDKPLTIYVVHHKTYENCNAFFTHLASATAYIKRKCEQFKIEESMWKINYLIEGHEFDADLTFLTNSNDSDDDTEEER